MANLYSLSLGTHTVFGLFGLILFWIPVALRKGSSQHKRIGRHFVLAMHVTVASGLAMAVMMYVDPIGIQARPDDLGPQAVASITAQSRQNAVFLMLLSVLVFTTVQRSVAALKAKDDRLPLRRPGMLILPVALGLFGSGVLWMAVQLGDVLFGTFAAVAILVCAANLGYAFKSRLRPNEWVLEHLGNTIGSGIGVHTGFLVFGASSLLDLPGNLMLIPWLAPTAIGFTAIGFCGFRYARTFGYSGSRAAVLREP